MSSSGANHDGGDDQEKDAEIREEKVEEKPEAAEEEIEDDPHEYPMATIARIDVVPNPPSLRHTTRISTGGKAPHHNLAAKSPYPNTRNSFDNLMHSHQLENCPKELLPTSWDLDRSNSAGKKGFGPEAEEKC